MQRVDLKFADELVEVHTNLWDQLDAERNITGPLGERQVEQGTRVWYSALKRSRPDHPAAKSYREFVAALVGVVTEDERTAAAGIEPGANGLDPTLPAVTAG